MNFCAKIWIFKILKWKGTWIILKFTFRGQRPLPTIINFYLIVHASDRENCSTFTLFSSIFPTTWVTYWEDFSVQFSIFFQHFLSFLPLSVECTPTYTFNGNHILYWFYFCTRRAAFWCCALLRLKSRKPLSSFYAKYLFKCAA